MITELLIITTVISQVVFVYMSGFQSVIGTEMCDNIPFMQTLGFGILESLPHNIDNREGRALATFLVAMSLCTLFVGCLFYFVGYFKIGKVLHICPRYVILGMSAGKSLHSKERPPQFEPSQQQMKATWGNFGFICLACRVWCLHSRNRIRDFHWTSAEMGIIC